MTQIGAVGEDECLESDKSTEQSYIDTEHSSTSSVVVIFDDDSETDNAAEELLVHHWPQRIGILP